MVKRQYRALMPIHLVHEHPGALALNSAAFGMLMRLVSHYWLTEGRPLPTTDHGLHVLARAHKPTWYEHRVAIKAILAELIPQFERARAAREARFANLSRLGDKGISSVRLNAMARKAHNASVSAPVIAPKQKQVNRAPVIKTDSDWQD